MWRKYLIEPNNSKLKKFHLLASLALFTDFFLTSFILGNYKFQIGLDDPDFMNYRVIYGYINTILGIDIFLMFIKQLKIDVIIIDDPKEIAWSYFSGQLIFDLISVLPWASIEPKYIYLRLLKIRKMIAYQKFFEEFINEIMQNVLNFEQIKVFINAIQLLLQIMFVSHFLANLWIYMGMYDMINHEKGWIVATIGKNIQKSDHISIYITAIYWIITTFSSVGYGDIVGDTQNEYLYQMLV